LCKKSLGLSILSGITVILYAGFVYSLEFMWMVYTETHVGKQFIVLHGVDISAVEGLLAEGFLVLSYRVVLAVLTACLALGAASRVFLLARYLYEGRGVIYDLIKERVMKKILIVDDRQEIREFVEMTLNQESRRVDRIGKTFLTQHILEIKTEVDKAA
jgi:hypothetical protein